MIAPITGLDLIILAAILIGIGAAGALLLVWIF